MESVGLKDGILVAGEKQIGGWQIPYIPQREMLSSGPSVNMKLCVKRPVEAQGRRSGSGANQGDYLSMKMLMKFKEAPARSWPKPN